MSKHTQSQYERYQQKAKNGSPVNGQDLAARLDNEEDFMFHFMVANDPTQTWVLLHHSDAPGTIGKGMTFAPDHKKALAQLRLLHTKGDLTTLNDIISHFRVNMDAKNWTTLPDLISEAERVGTIAMQPDGMYGLNVKIS